MHKKFLIALLATFVAPNAMSAEGAYNLVGFGLSPLTDQSNTTLGIGVSIGGGYNFNKYLGVETQLAVLGIGTGNNVSVMPLPALSLNGYFPLTEESSLYVKFGKSETVVANGTQSSYAGLTNFYGGGIEFAITGSKNTYRFGVDHYDLNIIPGATLSTNYINLSSSTHF
jgi:hypothetical protein